MIWASASVENIFFLIYGKSNCKSQLLMNNSTTFNNISDKRFSSEAYI